jgi:UDP-3-O-[3-hydroxymyristoyl] glucosamine N-acyltransferase
MKLAQPITTKEIAELLECRFSGDPHFLIHGINEIHRVIPGDLMFVDHPKYYEKALQSAATTIIVNQDIPCPEGKTLLISNDPCRDFNWLTRYFSPWTQVEGPRGTHSIGAGSRIHSSVILGNDVHIGQNCILHPGIVIYDHTTIGNDCIIHANTVIGSDAFYFKSHASGRDKMNSCGSVVIEDNVEIGACCTIDRGLTADTRIGRGTKLDNQVHIGHDTIVGKNCLMAAQVGIAGCVVLGDGVILWGQVGVGSGIHIGDRAVILGQSGVTKNVAPEQTLFGTPADDARTKFKELAILRNLGDNQL